MSDVAAPMRLSALLRRDGHAAVAEAVGLDA